MRSFRGLLLVVSVLLFVAAGGAVTAFLLQNQHWVAVRFPAAQLDWANPFDVSEWETPLYVVMLSCTVVGLVLATLAYIPLWLRRTVELNRDRRFIRNLEEELAALRNLPVDAPAPLEDLEEEPRSVARRKGRSAEALAGVDDDDEAQLMAALQADSGRAPMRR